MAQPQDLRDARQSEDLLEPRSPEPESYRSAETYKDIGKPCQNSVLDSVDILASLCSLLCLVAAVVVIDHVHFPFARQLQTDRQIVALGFLLGVMNLCLMRIFPHLILLIEVRCGSSTIQNIDGILRLSPTASQLAWHWRFLLVLLQAMPLGLSIAYKQFTGGSATFSQPLQDNHGMSFMYGPRYPPGLLAPHAGNGQYGAGVVGMSNAVMANSTVPFLNDATDDIPLPVDLSSSALVFGFNMAVLSDTSAVALDVPMPSRVQELQQALGSDPMYSVRLTAHVRGTVTTLNKSTGDYKYWEQTYPLSQKSLYNAMSGGINPMKSFAMAQQGYAGDNRPMSFNGSWALVAMLTGNEVLQADPSPEAVDIWLSRARRFDTARHNCTAQWHITRSSIELSWAKCAADPLPFQYQYYKNMQLGIRDDVVRSIHESLVPFGTTRNESQWLVPAQAVVIAAASQAKVAAADGFVSLQVNGPLHEYWDVWNAPGGIYNETYVGFEALMFTVPTLKAVPLLYVVLGITPLLTVVAVIGTMAMFRTPVSRDFGLVALLAGVDTATLSWLSGAGFSGKLRRSVPVAIRVARRANVSERSRNDTASGRRGKQVGEVTYQIGGRKTKDSIRSGVIYR